MEKNKIYILWLGMARWMPSVTQRYLRVSTAAATIVTGWVTTLVRSDKNLA